MFCYKEVTWLTKNTFDRRKQNVPFVREPVLSSCYHNEREMELVSIFHVYDFYELFAVMIQTPAQGQEELNRTIGFVDSLA